MADEIDWGPILDGLPDEAFTRDGVPKVDALEAAYAEAFPDAPRIEMTAALRDEIWAAHETEGADDTVTLISSQHNPLRVTVNGETVLEMQIGETADVAPEILALASEVPSVVFVRGTSNGS